MKKILLALDGDNFSEGAFEFASRLNKKDSILLTGIFLSQVEARNLWTYAVGVPPAVAPVLEESPDTAGKNVQRFRELCMVHHISYKIHEDYYGFAIPELKRESRFADVLLIGSQTFYFNLGGSMNEYLLNALHKTECPVLLVPENCSFPNSNILAYDGSGMSIYAIKQFYYTFPELCDNPTLLVYCEEKDGVIPEKENIQELAGQHFSNLEMIKLGGDPRSAFNKWITKRKSSIVVSGAFGRSALSQSFRKSFVTGIVREHRLPVFIAHK